MFVMTSMLILLLISSTNNFKIKVTCYCNYQNTKIYMIVYKPIFIIFSFLIIFILFTFCLTCIYKTIHSGCTEHTFLWNQLGDPHLEQQSHWIGNTYYYIMYHKIYLITYYMAIQVNTTQGHSVQRQNSIQNRCSSLLIVAYRCVSLLIVAYRCLSLLFVA